MAHFFKADDTSNFVIAITDNAVVPTGYSLVEANSVDAAVRSMFLLSICSVTVILFMSLLAKLSTR